MENYTILIFYMGKQLKKYTLKSDHAKHLEMQTHQVFWAREKPNNPIISASCFSVTKIYFIYCVSLVRALSFEEHFSNKIC